MTVNHSALGQALGYVYQFDRATFRLFKSDVDVIEIGIEDIDDVSVHFKTGDTIREQDKSTINSGSPLADRSVALWKTLHIWAELLIEDPLALERSEFHLVTNGMITKKSLAQRIHEANNEKLANDVSMELRCIIPTLREDLVPFGKSIDKLSDEIMRKMIQRISVFDKMSAKFGGNLEEIQSLRFFQRAVKISLFDQINGWIKRRIIECVENKKSPRILREEFDRELQALIRRVSVARLSALIEPVDQSVNVNEFKLHGFVQQLDWINMDEESIRDAIIQFSHAQNTRMKWTDSDLVSETTLLEYEQDLVAIWKTAKRRAARGGWPSEEIEGQDCMDLTISEDTYIDNEVMPKTITYGNFHALAHFTKEQDPKIGWHPKFKQRLEQEGNKE